MSDAASARDVPIHGPWADAEGNNYRAALRQGFPQIEILHKSVSRPDWEGEWREAVNSGGPAAALELQRLAGERDAAMAEGKRSGLLAAAVLAHAKWESTAPGFRLAMKQLAAELEALAEGGSDG